MRATEKGTREEGSIRGRYRGLEGRLAEVLIR